ncbi:hypothetical protein AAFN85_03340 [Mucilaginibacter sp. CAU 1740]|uniref:hypothetical protein n=1 Tax=Mucilaginibacter sp. CAU 1740 TaxID=3140365 RepID=UPI00325A828D
MRSSFKVIAGGILLGGILALLALREPDTPATAVKAQLLRQSDSLQTIIRQLQTVALSPANSLRLQQRFRQVRLAYKRLEWAAAYFDPLTTRQINGPPVPEVEFSGQVIQPDGLQVIEEMLFPRFSLQDKAKLAAALPRLAINAEAFGQQFAKMELQDWQVLDAAKQELFRVEILGLNDFDDPLLRNCFRESAAATASVAQVIGQYDSAIHFAEAIAYLRRPVSFDGFDRATFIKIMRTRLRAGSRNCSIVCNCRISGITDCLIRMPRHCSSRVPLTVMLIRMRLEIRLLRIRSYWASGCSVTRYCQVVAGGAALPVTSRIGPFLMAWSRTWMSWVRR